MNFRNDDVLYYAVMHHAVYGAIVRDGVIIEAAPIADWSIGRPIDVLIDVVDRRGGWVMQVIARCSACGFPFHSATHSRDEICEEEM